MKESYLTCTILQGNCQLEYETWINQSAFENMAIDEIGIFPLYIVKTKDDEEDHNIYYMYIYL